METHHEITHGLLSWEFGIGEFMIILFAHGFLVCNSFDGRFSLLQFAVWLVIFVISCVYND